MSPSEVLLLAFLIGIVAGLRCLSAPAVVAWAAYENWFHLHNSAFSFMASIVTVVIFTVLAVAELVGDKLPSTPPRTKPTGLIPRILTGALSGACIAVAGSQSIALCGLIGAVGAIVGAFLGYQFRTRLVAALKVPDFVIALAEDAVTIAGGLFIVSRF